MATKVVGVLREKKIEAKYFGSPNKLVDEDSSSRPARKIFLAKERGSASPAGKVLDFGEAAEDSAPRVIVCKICVAKGENSTSSAGCPFCLAKAAALDRIKAVGGNVIEIEEECKNKPLATVKAEYLDMVKAHGGSIVKKTAKKDGNGSMVKVKLPTSYVKGLMSVRPPTPLPPLAEDDLEDGESILASASLILYSIERIEKILAQFYEMGYAIADLEVVE